MSSTQSKDQVNDADLIVKHIDALIRLFMEEQIALDRLTRNQQLIALASAGLTTADIGAILGQKPKNVSSSLKKAKDASNKKKKRQSKGEDREKNEKQGAEA